MTSRAPLSGAGHVSVCFVIGQLGGQREGSWSPRGGGTQSDPLKAIDAAGGDSGNGGREWSEGGGEITQQQRAFDRQVRTECENGRVRRIELSQPQSPRKSRCPRWHLHSGKSRAADSTAGTMDR